MSGCNVVLCQGVEHSGSCLCRDTRGKLYDFIYYKDLYLIEIRSGRPRKTWDEVVNDKKKLDMDSADP